VPAADPGQALADLAARFALPEGAVDQLQALLTLIGGDPRAPTTVRDPERVLNDHLADSLVALEVAELLEAAEVADLGSGAGLPGLPLSIALPNARFHLVESNRRKCQFIARAIDLVQASNAAVVPARVEVWEDRRGAIDAVTARALAPLAVVAEYAAPLLRLGGTLIAWRGQRDADAEAVAAFAADELGLEVRPPVRVWPYAHAEHRHLHLMSKVRDTPSRFPRRPGVAAKRPLGASDRSRR
jgi:16S rRNA (guanine527-N7)-methyltransferase